MAGGRPLKYDPSLNEIVTNYCLLGATDDDLATYLSVDVRTILRWKKDHEEFCRAIKEGKEVADAKVARALYHRAIGYSHKDSHISNYQGDITITDVTKHYPPDTAAAFIWLKNRKAKDWTDKSEKVITKRKIIVNKIKG